MVMIQFYKVGVDEVLMLDFYGFVSICNFINFFIVRKGEVWMFIGDYVMKGIMWQKIIDVCWMYGILVFEKNFLLVDVYSVDEVFVIGMFGV